MIPHKYQNIFFPFLKFTNIIIIEPSIAIAAKLYCKVAEQVQNLNPLSIPVLHCGRNKIVTGIITVIIKIKGR